MQPFGSEINKGPRNYFQLLTFPTLNRQSLTIAAAGLILLYAAYLYNFLLFHLLAEIFSVIVAFATFMFAWNTRAKIHNNSLLLLGAAYAVIGGLDLLHTFSYKGMGVLQNAGADVATQLWIAARYIESVSLVIAPFLVSRKISMARMFAVYVCVGLIVLVTIFVWPVFPTCYVEGVGLTKFKKISEYAIASILVLGLIGLTNRRRHYDPIVFSLLWTSILLTIVAELMFTFYISVYGISNLVGHFIKLASFWLIYKAIIETGLQRPYTLLFRELAESEKRYRDLVDKLPTGICEFDADMRITYINPAGLAMIGYEAEDIREGINLGRILDSRDRLKAKQRMDDLLQGRAVGSTEYRLLRKDGGQEEVIVNTSPVYKAGKLKAVQTTLTDVTEINRLQRSLRQAVKMEAVAILASGLAHEINNILMGVIGTIELIQLKAADGEIGETDFDDVLNGCGRIAGLTNRLLAFSRGGRYRAEEIDPVEFIQANLTEFQTQLQPDVRLQLDLPPNLPCISVDPEQLKMVITEIFTNAAESINGRGRIELRLRSEQIDSVRSDTRPGMQPGHYVCFSLHDTGVGMTAEVLQHVFDPFYTNKFPGRGLGMAAVYGIVKNHRGWVGIDSRPGEGTTVRVYLPVKKLLNPSKNHSQEPRIA